MVKPILYEGTIALGTSMEFRKDSRLPVDLSESVDVGAVAQQQRNVGDVGGGAGAVQQVRVGDERRRQVHVVAGGQQVAQRLRVGVDDGRRQLATQLARRTGTC